MRPALPLLLAACFALRAQPLQIGAIDYYGAGGISKEKIQKELGVTPGGALPASKGVLEERIENLDGVVRASVEVYCCAGGRSILYVGLETRGAPHFEYRNPPTGPELLPERVFSNYREYLRKLAAASPEETAADVSQGHLLMSGRALRESQDIFVIHTELYLAPLRAVLRNSADGEHRAAAAYILMYARRKQDVVDDLQYALHDPDDAVRANSLRGLSAFAALAQREPGRGIRIAATWPVEMLHSILWHDRYRAAQALVSLTDTRDQAVLSLIRDRALDSVVEMARWSHLPHALPAFVLAGRVAGLSEEEVQTAWSTGDREVVIARLNERKKQ